MFQWASETSNHQAFDTFDKSIQMHLHTCLPESTSTIKSFQNQQMDMWRTYHTVRTSEQFVALWKELIGRVTSEPLEPAFFQDVTHWMFQAKVVAAFPLKESTPVPSDTHITYEDANIVRYISGYVCRKVRVKIEESSHSNKTELLRCLENLLADKEVQVKIEESSHSNKTRCLENLLADEEEGEATASAG